MSLPSHIGVVGIGLMGGSIAAALHARGYKGKVTGYARRKATLDAAQQTGWFDTLTDSLQEAVSEAELLIFCTPVKRIPHLFKEIQNTIPAGCVITDVGSTKQWLHEQMEKAVQEGGGVYIGSHPMCGSEQSGLSVARKDLYEGATVVLTPPKTPAVAQQHSVATFWEYLGARIQVLDARNHDQWVARVSHLPHLVSSALMGAIAREGMPEGLKELCATGYESMTRLAAGHPDMWIDIIDTNRDAITQEIQAIQHELTTLERHLQENDNEAVLAFLRKQQQNRQQNPIA